MSSCEPRNKVLLLTIISSSFSVFFIQSGWLWILVGAQCVTVVYLFKSDFHAFVPSLFWPLFLASLLALPWPLAFFLPIAAYLVILSASERFRGETGCLRLGKINGTALYCMVPTIVLSSAALVLWVYLLRPDLTDLTAMVPAGSTAQLAFVGLLFSVFNAAWEVIILKFKRGA